MFGHGEFYHTKNMTNTARHLYSAPSPLTVKNCPTEAAVGPTTGFYADTRVSRSRPSTDQILQLVRLGSEHLGSYRGPMAVQELAPVG